MASSKRKQGGRQMREVRLEMALVIDRKAVMNGFSYAYCKALIKGLRTLMNREGPQQVFPYAMNPEVMGPLAEGVVTSLQDQLGESHLVLNTMEEVEELIQRAVWRLNILKEVVQ